MDTYDCIAVESKWQERWEERGIFRAPEVPEGPHFYCLEMLPYPSGNLHMGQVRNYSIGDVMTRFRMMRGDKVLHPMGWDSLGLPAENAAIRRGLHPREWTRGNIERMRKQLRSLGLAYDWRREIATSEPEYYRWNQWFFLRMLDRGLAYRRKRLVNWCPDCGTVLANEQVEDGVCYRCETPVEGREMAQWFLRITDYADEILRDLDRLDAWPEQVRRMQRNWIGRSEGARIDFPVAGSEEKIPVFTTRLDTIYGATFVVIAPDHELLERLPVPDDRRQELRAFAGRVRDARVKARGEEPEEKEGMDTGVRATNPYNGEEIRVFAGNFVLPDYGTGAVMAVPAHDQRDFEFAKRYGIPVRVVVTPPDRPDLTAEGLEEAWVDYGILRESGPFDGLSSEEAIPKMVAYGEEGGFAGAEVDYRIKDWGISRQRYWGTPIPVVHCEACGIVPVPDEELPVVLPDSAPLDGEGAPLARVEEWRNVPCPACGKEARRDTDTMDTFVDSSWYHYRYCDPRCDEAPFRREPVAAWFPVDLYIGGVEHATLHLIYFRFWTKVMRDLGLVDHDEPVARLLTQGMVCHETYRCPEHGYLFPHDVDAGRCPECGSEAKEGRSEKMSKSKLNVVEPDAFIERYGADTLRLFCLFAAPPEKGLDWSESGIEGARRFLDRLWRLALRVAEEEPAGEEKEAGSQEELRRKTHRTIARVTEDVDRRLHLNTAIAAVMELVNACYEYAPVEGPVPRPVEPLREAVETALALLSPFAPHVTEELWERLGHEGCLANTPWPEADRELVRAETVMLVVQVNGKVRGKLEVAADTPEEGLVEAARADAKVAAHLEGREVVRTVTVPGRIVNFVVR